MASCFFHFATRIGTIVYPNPFYFWVCDKVASFKSSAPKNTMQKCINKFFSQSKTYCIRTNNVVEIYIFKAFYTKRIIFYSTCVWWWLWLCNIWCTCDCVIYEGAEYVLLSIPREWNNKMRVQANLFGEKYKLKWQWDSMPARYSFVDEIAILVPGLTMRTKMPTCSGQIAMWFKSGPHKNLFWSWDLCINP